ncbi:tRNA (adenosine(37)-N6)-dimethylallyltransferase MiaA [Ekhidna sp. To15]|uniref:tRNA (adenosine(37)-N6)-dimethylallyltransferase MiaA n=1 Tax=Ekhidna sp. To15 TaxID=3395267 RepID=UPI003F51D61D
MAISSKPLLISIVGPTAVGKTALAIELAQWLKTEIISADSRQFYKEMTIGTAKPTNDELAKVPHHYINSHSIEALYSAGEFGRDASTTIADLHAKSKAVMAVGGSGLYLKAIWEGFDDMPEVDPKIRMQLNDQLEREGLDKMLKELENDDPDYYNEVDRKNGQRIIRALEVMRETGKPFSSFRKRTESTLPYTNLKIGLNMDREVLFDRINHRMDVMIEEGLFEEAQALIDYRDHNALQTVGYSEIFGFLAGDYDKEEAVRLLKRNSRRYAKRQLTWFRRYDDIHWFEPDQIDDIKDLISKTLL